MKAKQAQELGEFVLAEWTIIDAALTAYARRMREDADGIEVESPSVARAARESAARADEAVNQLRELVVDHLPF